MGNGYVVREAQLPVRIVFCIYISILYTISFDTILILFLAVPIVFDSYCDVYKRITLRVYTNIKHVVQNKVFYFLQAVVNINTNWYNIKWTGNN